jgi:hypothetical protein
MPSPFNLFVSCHLPPNLTNHDSGLLDSTRPITHGFWHEIEDSQLRDAVRQCGVNHWESVASLVPGRTPTQCRERWMFRIGPGLNKAPFEEWEDELIIAERQRLGNRWTMIAQRLPGRTSCAVKNRWYAELRKQPLRGASVVPSADAPVFSVAHLLSRPALVRARL